MSKSLGIKIDIDYSPIEKLKKALKEKPELNIDISKASSKVDSLARKIQSINKNNEIKINLDTTSALKNIQALKASIGDLQQSLNKGMDLKVNLDSGKSLQDITAQAGRVKRSIMDATDMSNISTNMVSEYSQGVSKVVRMLRRTRHGVLETFTETRGLDKAYQSTHVNGVKTKEVYNIKGALNEMLGVMRDINSLELKQLSFKETDKEFATIANRIKDLNSMLDTLRNNFSGNPDDFDMIKNQKSLAQYNLEMQRLGKERQEQAAYDKQTEAYLSDLVKMSNEYHSLMVKADKAGDNETSVIASRANQLSKEIDLLIQKEGLNKRLSQQQQASLKQLVADNNAEREYLRVLTSAKDSDRAKASLQNDNYKELKADLKTIYGIEKDIADLRAKKDSEIITGKENSKLDALEREYEFRKRNYAEAKKIKELTESQQKSLKQIESNNSSKLNQHASLAKTNAELKKIDKMYDEVAQSIQKVHKLSQKLPDAGNEQASQIRRIIAAEEDLQQAILKRINAQSKGNKVREEELATQKRLNAEVLEEAEALRRAKRHDDYNDRLATNSRLTDLINPRAILQDLRQISTYMFDNVKSVDDQMVNIAKVVDAPKAELDAFAATIYDTASTVGKSADEYATSVERWASSGKDLQESIRLGRLSTIGAFVGNVDEAAMVDYMSVPLIAFKKHGLEATDIINSMNEVANNNAVEMTDLGAAYKIAAGTAAQAGTSFHELTGLISGAQEVTRQGGDKIGTALKAFDVNFGKIAGRIGKADQRKYDFFESIGVHIADSNGNLRSTYDILKDLSGVWSRLNSEQKSAAGFYAAGKHHQNILASLVTGWQYVEKAQQESLSQFSMGESGSAFKEFAVQQESLEFKLASLKNAWSEFIYAVSGGKDTFVVVMDAMTDGLQKLTELAKDPVMRNIGAMLLKVGGGLVGATAIKSGFSVLKMGVTDLFYPFGKLTQVADKANDAVKLTGAAASIGKLSAGFSKAIPYVGWLITGLELLNILGVDVWGTLGNLFTSREQKSIDEYTQKQKNLIKVMSDNKFLNGEITQAHKLVETYATLGLKKQQLYEITGDVSFLEWDEEEFLNFQQEFNANIDKLGLDQEFKITWNNHSHLMNQLDQFYQYLQKMTELEISNILTNLTEAYESKPEVEAASFKDFAKKNKNKYEKDASHKRANYGDTDAANADKEIQKLEAAGRVRDVYDYLNDSGVRDYITEQKNFFKGIKNIEDSFFDNLEKLNGSSLSGAFKDAFDGQVDKEGRERLFALMAYQAGEYSKKAQEAGEASAEFGKGIDKITPENFENNIDSLKQFVGEWSNSNSEIISDSEEVQKALKEFNANPTIEGLHRIKAEMDKFTETKKSNATKITDQLKDLAPQYGLDIGQIDKIVSSQKKGGLALINTLLETNEQLAETVLLNNYNGVLQGVFENLTDGTLDWKKAIVGAQEELDSLGLSDSAKRNLHLDYDSDGIIDAEVLGKMAELYALLGEDNALKLGFKLDGSGDLQEYLSVLQLSESAKEEVISKFNIQVSEDGVMSLEGVKKFIETASEEDKKLFFQVIADDAKFNTDIENIKDKWSSLQEFQSKYNVKLLSEKEGDVHPLQKSLEWLEKDIAPKLGEKGIKITAITEGEDRVESMANAMKLISEEDLRDVRVKLGLSTEGEVSIDQITEQIAGLLNSGDESQIQLAIDVLTKLNLIPKVSNKGSINNSIQQQVDEEGVELPEGEITRNYKVNSTFTASGELPGNDLLAGGTGVSIPVTVDPSSADQKIEETKAKINEGQKTPVAANTSSALLSISTLINRIIQPQTMIVDVRANITGLLASLLNGTARGSVAISGKKGSARIGNRLGQSFSASIGSALFGKNASSAIGKSNSNASKPATVNEAVWRYWGKDLYTGLPLDKSIDDLSREIKKSKDNYDQLIPLYRQQIILMKQQIEHQKDLKNAQQSEISEIIGKLSGYGFASDGNRITNLDLAKSLSGEQATEADKLLGEWKKLYESLNSIDKKIADLGVDIHEANEDIKQSEIKKELKQIENVLKRSEAILTAVENNTDLQSRKEEFVGDKDYDLLLGIKEESINTASRSMSDLLDEFNKLSTMTVQFEENADDVQKVLEKLKDSILDNADAVIKYREEIDQVRIDRMIDEYGKFNDVMNSNIERISNNIDQLKEGLLSGKELSDFATSQFEFLDFGSKSKLEKDHEARLNLEAKLNDALEGFAIKNVDRTKQVANSILAIEKHKYENLMRMASDYSNGNPISISNDLALQEIGITKAIDKEKSREYSNWQNKIKELHNAYSQEYAALVSRYDNLIKSSTTSAEKQLINAKMVTDQLSMQQKMYESIVKANSEIIALTKKELSNSQLTTDQRNQLLDSLKDYEKASIEAQKSIRETISARFDYEFSLIDKAIDRSEKYTKALEHFREIADLINMSSSKKQSLIDAVYAGKISQYVKAKTELSKLTKEQSKFIEGSYEWNLLAEKIDDVRDKFNGFSVDVLNANKDVLDNELKAFSDKFAKGLLDGKTLDEWKDYRENWVKGVSKELELEALRKRALDTESEIISRRLEALDMQDKVSKRDLEYMDKQLKAIELERKLKNISEQRKVQELIRNDDGTWGFGYSVDQTEYDKTKKELNDANKELDSFRQEQRQKYVEGLGSIIDNANAGKYQSPDDLRVALETLRAVYGTVLSDIPDIDNMSFDEIVAAYQKYVAANGMIVGDLLGKTDDTIIPPALQSISNQFELSFKNISADLGKIIGNELKLILGDLPNMGTSNVYHIGSLEFPSVTDAAGFKEVLDNLPTIATQFVLRKQ